MSMDFIIFIDKKNETIESKIIEKLSEVTFWALV